MQLLLPINMISNSITYLIVKYRTKKKRIQDIDLVFCRLQNIGRQTFISILTIEMND